MKYAILVYQAGLANVFEVTSLNLSDYGRDAKRLMQADFRSCEQFSRGLGTAGVTVRTASCNIAGDCAAVHWDEGPDATPFRDATNPVHMN